MTLIEHFTRQACAAGCAHDQVERLLAAGLILQPRQLAASAAARLCDRPDGPTAIGYGGARGGGKSHWLLGQMGADDCQRAPELKCLLLRKVGKANLEHFEDLRRKLFNCLPHEFAAFRGILTFANGSRIIAGHFQNEKDIDAYLGLEYDVIGIEEATTLTARKYQDITTCCRTSKPDWRPRIYSTTNPGGVGHAWYRRLFVDPYLRAAHPPLNAPASTVAAGFQPAVQPGFQPGGPSSLAPSGLSTINSQPSTIFIPARATDNTCNNPEYIRVLQGLTGWQRRAWLDGDWDIAAGQFFTTLRREVHFIHDFDDSRAREWFCAMDYGFAHYTVVLLGCTDGDGNLFIVDEHAERLWLPQRHAPAIHAMLARHGLSLSRSSSINYQRSTINLPIPRPFRPINYQPSTINRFVAGADVFSRQGDGTTIAAQYARQGIHLGCANTDRINGWAEIMTRFGDVDAGIRPSLFIHQRCARLMETLPALQHDPNRPEDVLKVDADDEGIGGDDCADCLRYLVATKGSTLTIRKLRGL